MPETMFVADTVHDNAPPEVRDALDMKKYTFQRWDMLDPRTDAEYIENELTEGGRLIHNWLVSLDAPAGKTILILNWW